MVLQLACSLTLVQMSDLVSALHLRCSIYCIHDCTVNGLALFQHLMQSFYHRCIGDGTG